MTDNPRPAEDDNDPIVAEVHAARQKLLEQYGGIADTESLYVDFRDQPSVASAEIATGVVVDYDADGHVVGIDIGLFTDIESLARFAGIPVA